jgi:hypothetical protein
VGEASWLFLLVGSFAAVGAAMAIGTLAALVRYRRTGTFPGSDEPVVLPQGKIVSMWVRVGVGLVITVVGVAAIQRSGLF